jgi:hypothetical protein
MSNVPLDVQRRFERRWARRFNMTPSPKQNDPSPDSRTDRTETARQQQPSQDEKARLHQRRVPC